MITPPSNQALLFRLEKLEAGNRRLRAMAIAGPLLALAVFLLGQAAPSATTIEARELVLRDAQGRKRIVLSAMAESAPTIAILDEKERVRAALALRGEVPAVLLRRASGQEGARMALEPTGPVVYLYDKNQIARTGLAILNNELPGLFLRDENRKQRLSLTVQGEDPALFFLDEKEKTRLQFAIHDGKPLIYFNDREEKVRLSLLVNKQGYPSINMRDVDTNSQAQFSVSSSGPSLVMVDPGGNRAFDAVPRP